MADTAWLARHPYAHRGLHDPERGPVENTLPAVDAALAAGFGVEIDVRLTADGRVVVFHDADLERLTTATGVVGAMPLDDLRAVSFRLGNARIPTLDEVLDRIDGRAPLLVEIKANGVATDALLQGVGEALSTYDGPAAAMSFDHMAMVRYRRMFPDLVRGMVAGRYPQASFRKLSLARRLAYRHLALAPAVLPHFVAYDIKALPASAPLALRHFFRVPLLTWTVRSADDRRNAARWTDQIIFEEERTA